MLAFLLTALDVLIVDKNIDLNVYKDGSDLLNDEEIKSGERSSDIKGAASNVKHPSCCGSSNTPNSKENCNFNEQQRLKLAADVDFNEWVGKFST
jgi:hypothetical protein